MTVSSGSAPTAAQRASTTRWVIGLALFALALRLGFAVVVWEPGFRRPDLTITNRFALLSDSLASGRGYSLIGPDGLARPDYLYPPGWALIGAGFGKCGLPFYTSMQVLGAVLDSLALVLLFALITEVFGSRVIGIVAALLYAAFPPLVFNAVTAHPFAASPFLAVALTWLIARWANARPHRGLLLVSAGLTASVLVYLRSDFLLLGPILACASFVKRREVAPVLGAAAAIAAITAFALLPWAYRNYSTSGRWIFTSTAKGASMLAGIGAYPNPWGIGPADADRERDAKAHGIDDPWSPEANELFQATFLKALRDRPTLVVGNALRRLPIGLAPPLDWGVLESGPSISFTRDIQSRGDLLANLGLVLQRYWMRSLSSLVLGVALICTLVMYVREFRRNPLVLLIVVGALYGFASHSVIQLLPQYLVAGVAAYFVGLAYAGISLVRLVRTRKAG